MVKIKYVKFLLLIFSLFISALSTAQNLPVDSILSRFNTQTAIFPQEKIYTQTDRAYYFADDTIRFSSYLVDAKSHTEAEFLSNYIYGELINSANDVVTRVKIMRQDGVFTGYIPIAKDVASGVYKLRFYTGFMLNLPEDYYFSKNIYIGNYSSVRYSCKTLFSFDENRARVNMEIRIVDNQNSQIIEPEKLYVYNADNSRNVVKYKEGEGAQIKLRSSEIANSSVLVEYTHNGIVQKEYIRIPAEDDDFTVDFFAEGGNVVEGVINRISFKSLNSKGAGEDITGYIVSQNGDTLTSIASTHLGMGAVGLMIANREPLFAICKNSKGVEKRFTLPEVDENQISLKVESNQDKLYISVNRSSGTSINNLRLLIHLRGEVLFSQMMDNSKDRVVISKEALPSGVLHLLLLNGELAPISERLLFNKNMADIATAEFTTSQPSYKARERVEAQIKVEPLEGEPISGKFSISVVDDSIAMPLNILTTLLLTSDLKGYVESPATYFEPTQKAEFNLDVLMLTQGWRRYKVEELLLGSYDRPTIGVEYTQEISGSVYGGLLNNRSAKKYSVELLVPANGESVTTKSDDNGNYLFRNLTFVDSTAFVVQTLSRTGGAGAKIEVNDEYFAERGAILPFVNRAGQNNNLEKMDSNQQESTLEDEFYNILNRKNATLERMREHQIETVVITAERVNKTSPTQHWASSSFGTKIESEEIMSGNPPTMLDFFRRHPSFYVTYDYETYSETLTFVGWGGGSPIIYVDGVETDFNHLGVITPEQVESVEIQKGSQSFFLGSKGLEGAVFITLKEGENIRRPSTRENVKAITPLGYQITKEFYCPKYDTKAKKDSAIPDDRATIYWNGNNKLSEDGTAKVEFYTSDSKEDYSVIIEGLTSDGRLIYGVGRIKK